MWLLCLVSKIIWDNKCNGHKLNLYCENSILYNLSFYNWWRYDIFHYWGLMKNFISNLKYNLSSICNWKYFNNCIVQTVTNKGTSPLFMGIALCWSQLNTYISKILTKKSTDLWYYLITFSLRFNRIQWTNNSKWKSYLALFEKVLWAGLLSLYPKSWPTAERTSVETSSVQW